MVTIMPTSPAATHRAAAHMRPHSRTVRRAPSRGAGVPKTQRNGAIDALRALAIAGVVLYHTRPSLLTGGFVGVTIFFVLTGFFATRSVTRALDQGSFSYARYVLGRVVRLLPAVLIVVALTALGAYLVAPSLLEKARADALPATLFLSNWSYILRQVSYFDAAGLPSPLTHLWYLGVVMQFYLIWPLVLMVVARRGGARARSLTAIVAVAGMALSAAVMALLFDPAGDTARVYYGTDARAAELLAGALAALALPPLQRRAGGEKGPLPKLVGPASTVAGGCCLVALLICLVVADGQSAVMYRGGYLAVALVVAVLLVCVQLPGCALARRLDAAPLRWLGSRSFSVYLVHYPLLTFMNPATRTTAPAWWELVAQLVVVLLASELFYRLVEAPSAALARRLSARGESRAAARVLPAAAVPAVLGTAGAVAVVMLTWAPVNWDDVVWQRSVELRPELAAPAPAEPADQPEVVDPSAPADDGANAAADEGGGDAADEAAKPIAEKVPENLPWQSWTYDAAAGTCDARALIIGDSVTAGAAPSLQALLPNARVDGKVSRQFYVGQDVYAADVADGFDPDVVIYALGTNGVIRDESIVQPLIDAAGDRPVYFVTIRCPLPLQDPNNQILRTYAANHPNVGIIDWNGASAGHPEYLTDDGIHLTPTGMSAYTDLVRQALCGA